MSQPSGSDAESAEHVSEEEVLAVDELSDAESVYEDIVPQQKVEIDNKVSTAFSCFQSPNSLSSDCSRADTRHDQTAFLAAMDRDFGRDLSRDN